MTGQMTKLEALNAIILDKLGGTRRADSMLEAINMVVAAYGGKGDKINMADALEELYTVYDKGGQVDPYTGPTEITPSLVEQVLEIAGKTPSKNITVKAVEKGDGLGIMASISPDKPLTVAATAYIYDKNETLYAKGGVKTPAYYDGPTMYGNNGYAVQIHPFEKAKLIPGNIKKDVTLLGVTGTLEEGGEVDPYTGTMTVTPSTTEQTLPTDGKTVTGDIKVEAIEQVTSQEGITLDTTSWEPYVTYHITAKNEHKALSPIVKIAGYYSRHWGTSFAVGVDIEETEQAKIIPENIRKDVSILGVTGTLETGETDPYTGPTEITPSFVDQVLETTGKTPTENITVKAITPVKLPDEITLSGDGYISTKDDVKTVYATVGEVGWYKTGSTNPVEVAIADAEKAKLTPKNIRKDVSILGVTGTLDGEVYPTYTGTVDVTPAETDTTLATQGKLLESNITVRAAKAYNALKSWFAITGATMQDFFRAKFNRWTDDELAAIFPTPDTTADVTSFEHLNSYVLDGVVKTTNALANVTKFPAIDISKATTIRYMFYSCYALSQIDIDWTQLPANVTAAYRVFTSCRALTAVPSLPWEQMTNMGECFDGAGTNSGLTVSSWRFPALITADKAFYNSGINEVKDFYAPLLTSGQEMFGGCKKLTQITGDFYAPKLTSIIGTYINDSLFADCASLAKVGDTDNPPLWTVDSLYGAFYSDTALEMVNIILANSGTMAYAFASAGKGTCHIKMASAANAKVCKYMFSGSGFTDITLEGVQPTDAEAMFKNADVISLSDLDLSSITTTTDMFTGCETLTTLVDTDSAPAGSRWQFKTTISFADSPLDKASALKIINGVQTVTSTKTLTLSATTKGYFTEAEWADAEATMTSKGWTLAA